jgi:hypothetical protein
MGRTKPIGLIRPTDLPVNWFTKKNILTLPGKSPTLEHGAFAV